jgi:hypothetical protein
MGEVSNQVRGEVSNQVRVPPRYPPPRSARTTLARLYLALAVVKILQLKGARKPVDMHRSCPGFCEMPGWRPGKYMYSTWEPRMETQINHTAQVQSLATEANVQYSPAVVLLVLQYYSSTTSS